MPEGAYASMDSVVGQTTKVFMGAREPVTAIKLSSRGGGLSMLVRPSMRAASLEVNQVSGVSGSCFPATASTCWSPSIRATSNEDAVTRTVLQNTEVIAAGQKTEQQDNKPITVQAVTVLVTPDGAETLALALHEGKIHLVLRNPEDQDGDQGRRALHARDAGEQAARGRARDGRLGGVRRAAAGSGGRVSVEDPQKVRIIRSANVT